MNCNLGNIGMLWFGEAPEHITLDFESKMTERAENRKILKEKEATDYIGFDLQATKKNNTNAVNLLRLFDESEVLANPPGKSEEWEE